MTFSEKYYIEDREYLDVLNWIVTELNAKIRANPKESQSQKVILDQNDWKLLPHKKEFRISDIVGDRDALKFMMYVNQHQDYWKDPQDPSLFTEYADQLEMYFHFPILASVAVLMFAPPELIDTNDLHQLSIYINESERRNDKMSCTDSKDMIKAAQGFFEILQGKQKYEKNMPSVSQNANTDLSFCDDDICDEEMDETEMNLE